MTLVVIGAGIVGAAVAHASARAGAQVLLVDTALPASGVTGASFAWIGGPSGGDVPDASSPVRRRVVQAYRRLEREVPGVSVRWSGSLVWLDEAGDPAPLGPDEQLLGPDEVARLEPHLAEPPPRALHRRSDGAVDPVAVTQALAGAARDHGAELLTACAVTRLRLDGHRVVGVETSAGFLPATRVVVAAGVGAPALCAPLGLDLPVAPSPAVLMRFTGPPGLVRTLVATPHLEVREAGAGRLLVAAAYQGEADEHDLRHAGEDMLRRLVATFRGAEDVRLDAVTVGMRPMPADGLPVVGPVPGVDGAYVAVMHSGVTLAPAVAQLVAAEVVHGATAADLEGLRPDRFSPGVRG